MKRSPLNRYTPLQRGGPLKRTARLNPVSKKRAAIQGERRRMVKEELTNRPECEAGRMIFAWRVQQGERGDHGCTGLSSDIHEPLTRGRGGSITDPANTVALCRPCHDWIHGNPLAATGLGLLKRAEPNNVGQFDPDNG
jgi:hypothetical protein